MKDFSLLKEFCPKFRLWNFSARSKTKRRSNVLHWQRILTFSRIKAEMIRIIWGKFLSKKFAGSKKSTKNLKKKFDAFKSWMNVFKPFKLRISISKILSTYNCHEASSILKRREFDSFCKRNATNRYHDLRSLILPFEWHQIWCKLKQFLNLKKNGTLACSTHSSTNLEITNFEPKVLRSSPLAFEVQKISVWSSDSELFKLLESSMGPVKENPEKKSSFSAKNLQLKTRLKNWSILWLHLKCRITPNYSYRH